MALTNAEIIAQLYIGYYDRAPDPEGLEYWLGRLEAGVPLADIADSFATSPEAQQTYPQLDLPNLVGAEVVFVHAFLEQVYQNLFGRPVDDDGRDYYTDKLITGATPVGQIIAEILANATTNDGSPDQALLANKVEVALYWTGVAAGTPGFVYELGSPAAASAAAVLKLVTADPASVAEANAATDAFFESLGIIPGETFNLTPAIDTVVGTEGDDTINGFIGVDGVTTYNALDTIDGAGGVDTFNLVVGDPGFFGSHAFPYATTTVQNVEIVNIWGANFLDRPVWFLPGQVDASHFEGLEELWLIGGDSDFVAVTEVGDGVTIGLRDQSANVAVIASGGVTALAVALDEASGAVSFQGDDVDTVSISGTVAGGEFNIDDDTLDGITTVNLAIESAATIDFEDAQAVVDVDGSASTGDLELEDLGAAIRSVTTGTGNDFFVLNSAGPGTVVVSTGDGDDAVIVNTDGNIVLDIDLGDGDDLVDLSFQAISEIKTSDRVEGGDGFDTVVLQGGSGAGGTFILGDYVRLEEVLSGFEKIEFVERVQIDASQLASYEEFETSIDVAAREARDEAWADYNDAAVELAIAETALEAAQEAFDLAQEALDEATEALADAQADFDLADALVDALTILRDQAQDAVDAAQQDVDDKEAEIEAKEIEIAAKEAEIEVVQALIEEREELAEAAYDTEISGISDILVAANSASPIAITWTHSSLNANGQISIDFTHTETIPGSTVGSIQDIVNYINANNGGNWGELSASYVDGSLVLTLVGGSFDGDLISDVTIVATAGPVTLGTGSNTDFDAYTAFLAADDNDTLNTQLNTLNAELATLEGELDTLEDELGVPSDDEAEPPVVATGLYLVLENAQDDLAEAEADLADAQAILDDFTDVLAAAQAVYDDALIAFNEADDALNNPDPDIGAQAAYDVALAAFEAAEAALEAVLINYFGDAASVVLNLAEDQLVTANGSLFVSDDGNGEVNVVFVGNDEEIRADTTLLNLEINAEGGDAWLSGGPFGFGSGISGFIDGDITLVSVLDEDGNFITEAGFEFDSTFSSNTETLTISGTGFAEIFNDNGTSLVEVDASGLTDGGLFYASENGLAETIILGDSADFVALFASTVAATDTIFNFSTDDDFLITQAFSYVSAGEIEAGSLNLALLEVADLGYGAFEGVVFDYGGDTYVYQDLNGNGQLDSSDGLVRLAGGVDHELAIGIV